jgi:hypothetical protein
MSPNVKELGQGGHILLEPLSGSSQPMQSATSVSC